MKWTKELPKESGLYWMKHEGDENELAKPIEFSKDMNWVYQIYSDVPLGLYEDDFEELLFSDEKIICDVKG